MTRRAASPYADVAHRIARCAGDARGQRSRQVCGRVMLLAAAGASPQRSSAIQGSRAPVQAARRYRVVVAVVQIRQAAAGEAPALEALQRRSSDVWEQYRDQVAASPDAIELPETFIDNGRVQVAIDAKGTPIGFSVVIPADDRVHELDGLFVEPDRMACGVGRALVEDAAARASAEAAGCLEVTAGPAQGFYERVGFRFIGTAQTRFGPPVRMRRTLQG